MQQRLVNFSSLDAISIAKLNIDTDFQWAAMSHSNYNFQLMFDLTLITYCEGARAVRISPYSAFEGDQNLSSASDKLIMFSLTTIHIQQLIVAFIKPNANIPLSNLEGAQHAQINLWTFQLIVDLFLNPNCEGARPVPITSSWASDAASQNANLQTTNNFQQGATSHFCNKHLRRLIVDSNSEGAQFAPMITASAKAASIFFNVKFKFIVKSASDALHSEGAWTVPTISFIELHGPTSKLNAICNWTKISLIFQEDCDIFCEGVKAAMEKSNGLVGFSLVNHNCLVNQNGLNGQPQQAQQAHQ
jgi:hypothetical protein